MGSRTDTIMLVQVVPRTGDVKLLSVPRDLLVEVEPGRRTGSTPPTTTAASNETIDALENYADVPIDHSAVVDFQGFEKSSPRWAGSGSTSEKTNSPRSGTWAKACRGSAAARRSSTPATEVLLGETSTAWSASASSWRAPQQGPEVEHRQEAAGDHEGHERERADRHRTSTGPSPSGRS